jgi:hypothetical protein
LLLGAIAWHEEANAAQLGLTWTNNSTNEDGFKIERATGTTGTFAQIAITGANATSYSDSGLADATTYCYRVRAFNTAGDSAYSNVACGTTPQTFGLAVVRAGTGSGTVTSSPAGITCGTSCAASFPSGTAVTLTATPAAGSTFTGWSGGGCTGTGACTVTLTANTTVTATFNDTTLPTVSITAPGAAATVGGMVSVAATATDNVGVGGVQFRLDGVNLGAEVTVPPYAVSWNTTAAVNGAHTLTAVARDAAGNVATSAAVTVTVANSTTISSTLSVQNVIWTNLVNVTATGNSIQKTGGCDGCEDAGATSQQQILSGDGYLEFTASETTTLRFVGLSTGNTGTGSAEIRFAIRLQSGIAQVQESGIFRTNTTFVTGDVFRISVESGVVKYYKNGGLLYTSALAPTYPLLVDSTLASPSATITNAVIAGVLSTTTVTATALVISAVAAVNLSASGATITWTTNVAGDSQVEYGPTTAYGSSTAPNPSLVTSHSQMLSGLAPSTVYHYRVKSRDAVGNLATSGDGTFTTAAAPQSPPSHRKKKSHNFDLFDSIGKFFRHLF